MMTYTFQKDYTTTYLGIGGNTISKKFKIGDKFTGILSSDGKIVSNNIPDMCIQVPIEYFTVNNSYINHIKKTNRIIIIVIIVIFGITIFSILKLSKVI